jgi:hypothetical protein
MCVGLSTASALLHVALARALGRRQQGLQYTACCKAARVWLYLAVTALFCCTLS